MTGCFLTVFFKKNFSLLMYSFSLLLSEEGTKRLLPVFWRFGGSFVDGRTN
jgi:hypothetical protein